MGTKLAASEGIVAWLVADVKAQQSLDYWRITFSIRRHQTELASYLSPEVRYETAFCEMNKEKLKKYVPALALGVADSVP